MKISRGSTEVVQEKWSSPSSMRRWQLIQRRIQVLFKWNSNIIWGEIASVGDRVCTAGQTILWVLTHIIVKKKLMLLNYLRNKFKGQEHQFGFSCWIQVASKWFKRLSEIYSWKRMVWNLKVRSKILHYIRLEIEVGKTEGR